MEHVRYMLPYHVNHLFVPRFMMPFSYLSRRLTLLADTRFSLSLSSCKPPAIHSTLNVSQESVATSTVLYNLTHKVNCHALGQTAQVLGNIAVGTATLNILYRAWAVSLRYGRFLTISLGIAEVGHWAILVWNVFTVRSEWVESVAKCNVTLTSRPALVTLYAYSTSLFHHVVHANISNSSPQRCFSTLRSS
jgi:hypothetical protein